MQRKGRLDCRGHDRDRPPRRRRVPRLGHDDAWRTQASPARRRSPPTSSGCERSSTWRSSAGPRRPRDALRAEPASGSASAFSDRVRLGGLSACAVHVLGRRSTGPASSSGCPSRRTSRRRAPSTTGSSRAAGPCRRTRTSWPRRHGDRDPPPRPRGPPRPVDRGSALRHGRRGGDPAPRRARRRRSCTVHARTRCSGAEWLLCARCCDGRPPRRPRHGQPRLDPLASTCSTRCAPRSLSRERRQPTRAP